LPVCKKLQFDNRLGRYIFALTGAIQKSAVLKRAVLRMVFREQRIKRENRIMSSMLWDTFTGSTPYNSIFYRFFNPRVFFFFIWDSVISIFANKKSKYNEI
jgi:hypothetical protein